MAADPERFEPGAEAVAFLLTVLVFERDLALVVDVRRTVRVVAHHPFRSRYRSPCWSTGRADRARLDRCVGDRSVHHALGRSGLGDGICLGVNMAPNGDDQVVRRVAGDEGGKDVRRVQGPDFDRVRDDFGRRTFFDADNFGPGDLKGGLPAYPETLV